MHIGVLFNNHLSLSSFLHLSKTPTLGETVYWELSHPSPPFFGHEEI
jgi:hypothetical protein